MKILNNTIIITTAVLLFIFCDTKEKESTTSLVYISDTKTMQYAIEGKILYEKHCANCHQLDGTGLGRVIPPLVDSDYMREDVGRTVKIIKHGLKGEIEVNGIIYNQNMPANPQLTNMEIAQITTYIYNVWGNKQELIDANEVAGHLQ